MITWHWCSPTDSYMVNLGCPVCVNGLWETSKLTYLSISKKLNSVILYLHCHLPCDTFHMPLLNLYCHLPCDTFHMPLLYLYCHLPCDTFHVPLLYLYCHLPCDTFSCFIAFSILHLFMRDDSITVFFHYTSGVSMYIYMWPWLVRKLVNNKNSTYSFSHCCTRTLLYHLYCL